MGISSKSIIKIDIHDVSTLTGVNGRCSLYDIRLNPRDTESDYEFSKAKAHSI